MAELDYKPFRFFGTKASYDSKRSSGDIDDRTVCLIKDTGKIMLGGVPYGGDLPVLYELGTQAEYEHNQAVIAQNEGKATFPILFVTSTGSFVAYYADGIIRVFIDLFLCGFKQLDTPVVGEDGTLLFYSISDTINAVTTEDLENKQDTLVSGENIKTINGKSLLGSGDITIEGGGDDLAMPVLREGESSSALYDQLADKAGNDVESVGVKYISADGMMYKGTWFPTQGYLDVHTMSGVYRLEFDDVVAGMADATFIETAVESVLYAGLGMKDYHIEHNLSLLNGWKSETPLVMSKRCVVYEVDEQIKFDGVVFPEAMTVRLHKAQGDSDYVIPESGAIVL